MAAGTGNLPYPGKSYTPFDILTAEELNEDVANIESLATGTGIGDRAIPASRVNFSTFNADTTWDTGWQTPSFTAGTSGTIKFKRRDNVVYMVGSIVRTLFTAPYVAVFTLPAGYRPTVDFRQAMGSFGGTSAPTPAIRVTASTGLVEVFIQGTGDVGTVYTAASFPSV